MPQRPGTGPLFALLLVGVVVLAMVVWLTPALHDVAELLWLKLKVLLGTEG